MVDKKIVKYILAREETPFYLYDSEVIKKNILYIKKFLSVVRNTFFLYAIKANENIEIIKIMTQSEHGFGVDVCSPEEILLAINAGVLPKNIYYNSDCVSINELSTAHHLNVNIIIGSIDALNFAISLGIRRLALRINTGVGAGHSEKVITNGEDSKFGVQLNEIDDIIRICKLHEIKIIGLHSHIGSGELDRQAYSLNARILLSLTPLFQSIQWVNLGGGFGFDYIKHAQKFDFLTLAAEITQYIHDYQLSSKVKIGFEPGRFIVANSGMLITKVCSVKNVGNKKYIGINSGYNHFPRCFYYGAYHEICNISTLEEEKEVYDICGYLCQSGDIFARGRLMSKTHVNDILCILDTGAYGFSMSSHFNARVKPPEFLLVDKTIFRIRRRENIDDIMRTQVLEEL